MLNRKTDLKDIAKKIFIIGILLIASIPFLPITLFIGVYSLTDLGYIFFIFILPLTVIAFIFLSIKNFLNRNLKSFYLKLIVLLIVFLIYHFSFS